MCPASLEVEETLKMSEHVSNAISIRIVSYQPSTVLLSAKGKVVYDFISMACNSLSLEEVMIGSVKEMVINYERRQIRSRIPLPLA